MYLLLIFLSLIGCCFTGLFGRYLGLKGSFIITTSCVIVSFLLSIFAFYEVSLMESFVYIKLSPLIKSTICSITWGFMFDRLTVIMCVVVTFISSLVHLYSSAYLPYDCHLSKFMSYLSLVTFFMLILITADNYIQMFLGWEGVGLCSYLLLNFWSTKIQAKKSAGIMIINRIGDFSLIIVIFIMFVHFNAIDYSTIEDLTPLFTNYTIKFLNFNFNLLFLIGIFLFFGAVGKLVQLSLYTEFLVKMESPIPVSALLHAATMLTAGVFLIARSSFIYKYTLIISIIGATMIIVSLRIVVLQNDLKRVIAYFTCNQLGYMIFSWGFSNYSGEIFHVATHAFFKVLIFLGAGAIIYLMTEEQNMKKMKGLTNLRFFFTYSILIIGSLVLIGFPFLSDFYSKDLLVKLFYKTYFIFSQYWEYFGTFGAFLIAFYFTRLLCLTFLVKQNGYKNFLEFANEPFNFIFIVLCCLFITSSICIGYLTKELIVYFVIHFLKIFIYTTLLNNVDSECIDFFICNFMIFILVLQELKKFFF